jgi:putative transport protein
MLVWLHDFLVKYPELALFLTIGIGYWVGGVRLGNFKLGPVTGSLFAGIALGQFAHVPISGMAKSFLFLLFLFGIGYSVGPQFLQALKRDGLKPVLLAVVMAVTGLLTAVTVARLLGLDPGFAAGLLSGSLTESPAMGTATEAINALPIPEADRARFVAHIAVADAVCYIFGAAGMIWFLSSLAPRLINADLVAESRRLEQELGIERGRPGIVSGWRAFELRAYRAVEGGPAIGRSVAELEQLAVAQGHRIFIQRIRRDGALLTPTLEDTIRVGDLVAVSGPRHALVNLIGPGREEVEDRELLDIPVAVFDVLLTNRAFVGRTLAELAEQDWARGVHLRAITRGGEPIPVGPTIELQRGDLLRVAAPEPSLERAAKLIGPVVQPTEATDFVVLGLGIFLGGLVGVLISFPVGGLNISLSTSVGTLLAGLVVGHLRTRHPLFGRMPDGAIALMTSLGLAAFVAMTGLHAGPIFFSALAEAGIGLFLGGIVVTSTPLVVGLYFGRYVLKMNPVLLLGAIAGAQTMTAAMAAVQERAGSPVAVLGYTPAVPIGHILLTTWGAVIVGLVAS